MHQDLENTGSAFGFDGQWREFLPIALTNLLLTLVTLGIYRFWATTRERRYLWSRTRFIDERFEWSGTGLELLIGFLLVAVLVFLPLFLLPLVAQGLLLNGHYVAFGLLFALLYLFLFYLFGVARFRALRYRLSRSWWRGIRGGSDDQGYGYGWSYVWKTVIGMLAMGLMVPWSMTRLWNERWNRMSFGGHAFEAKAFWGNVFLRYILCYLAPFALFILAGILIFTAGVFMGVGDGGPGAAVAIVAVIVILALYIVLPLIALAYYAAFLREAVGALRLTGIDFEFTARTKDWVLLFLGNVGLWLLALLVALVPLSIFGLLARFAQVQPGGSPFADDPISFLIFIVAIAIPFTLVSPFIRYRGWRFGVRHLEASGEIDADALVQSTTRAPTQGEGLLDAFDIGAV